MENSGNYRRVDGDTVAKERSRNYRRVEGEAVGRKKEESSKGLWSKCLRVFVGTVGG